MRAFERCLRRTGLPLRMTEGFNPRPHVSFPAPLAVGMEGTDEVMEFDLSDWVQPVEIERRVREQLPGGLELVSLELSDAHKAAQATEMTYVVFLDPPLQFDARLGATSLEQFMVRDQIPAVRIRKGKPKTVNVRPYVLSLQREEVRIVLRVKAGAEGSTRPEEILGALGFDAETCRSKFRIVRTRVQLAP